MGSFPETYNDPLFLGVIGVHYCLTIKIIAV